MFLTQKWESCKGKKKKSAERCSGDDVGFVELLLLEEASYFQEKRGRISMGTYMYMYVCLWMDGCNGMLFLSGTMMTCWRETERDAIMQSGRRKWVSSVLGCTRFYGA